MYETLFVSLDIAHRIPAFGWWRVTQSDSSLHLLICPCVCVFMCVCACVYMCVCVSLCVGVWVCIYMYTCMYMHVCLCTSYCSPWVFYAARLMHIRSNSQVRRIILVSKGRPPTLVKRGLLLFGKWGVPHAIQKLWSALHNQGTTQSLRRYALMVYAACGYFSVLLIVVVGLL